jgi:hypothetical protein
MVTGRGPLDGSHQHWVTRKGSAGRSRPLQRRTIAGMVTGGHLQSNDRLCLGIG